MRVRCAKHNREYEESRVRAKQVETLGAQKDWMSKMEERFTRLEQQLARVERLLEILQPNDGVDPEELQRLVDEAQS